MSVKFSPSGTYLCPVCGRPRGGVVNRGVHDACYRITQQQYQASNLQREAQRLARARASAKAYRAGRLFPGALS